MFYEKELINSISFGNFNNERLDQSERNLDDMAQADLRRDLTFDPKVIEKSFSDASITVHFIYLTQPSQITAGFDVQNQLRNEDLETKDLSSSLYMSFREMARATGGVSEASANPFASFRKAATAMENYYLLYYVPENYRADGKFREIKVEVKGKRFQVTHRAGYFAN